MAFPFHVAGGEMQYIVGYVLRFSRENNCGTVRYAQLASCADGPVPVVPSGSAQC